MDKLNKDELFSIALILDLPEILNFCNSSKRINQAVCREDYFWKLKLQNSFPVYDQSLQRLTARETYTLLYKLYKVKKGLDLDMTLRDIYYTNQIFADGEEITEIPVEIQFLPNLTHLEIDESNVEEIPVRLLTNLNRLSINDSNIKKIPKNIGELQNLRYLSLSGNEIEKIPKEIGQLRNLGILFLSDNEIKKLPKEVGNMRRLSYFYLEENPIEKVPREIKDSLPITKFILNEEDLYSDSEED